MSIRLKLASLLLVMTSLIVFQLSCGEQGASHGCDPSRSGRTKAEKELLAKARTDQLQYLPSRQLGDPSLIDDNPAWYMEMPKTSQFIFVTIATILPFIGLCLAFAWRFSTHKHLLALVFFVAWLYFFLPVAVLVALGKLDALAAAYWSLSTLSTVGAQSVPDADGTLRIFMTCFSMCGMLCLFMLKVLLIEELRETSRERFIIWSIALAGIVIVNTLYWSVAFNSRNVVPANTSPYIAGLYFSMSTMTTVGFEDELLKPVGPNECIAFFVTAGLGIPIWLTWLAHGALLAVPRNISERHHTRLEQSFHGMRIHSDNSERSDTEVVLEYLEQHVLPTLEYFNELKRTAQPEKLREVLEDPRIQELAKMALAANPNGSKESADSAANCDIGSDIMSL